jgi:HEAT repeat protein
LHSDHPVLVRATAEALGRCSVAAAETPLRRLLTSEDTAIRETALLALFLINPVRSEENCRQLCRAGEALGGLASLLLATRGNLSDYPILLRRGQPFELDRVGLEAIGVVGNVHAVPLLLQALLSEREEVPVAASEALELITGAGLRETILFEETLEAFDFKLGPREIERISTSFVAWTDWWARHRPRFDPRQRWRRGQVFDLTQCVAELEGNYRFHERRRAYWELRAGSERAMPFEPDWFVPRQRQAIAAWAARIQNRR